MFKDFLHEEVYEDGVNPHPYGEGQERERAHARFKWASDSSPGLSLAGL